jgi:photosystem II stability/assembly factor-like uncharacterized protein
MRGDRFVALLLAGLTMVWALSGASADVEIRRRVPSAARIAGVWGAQILDDNGGLLFSHDTGIWTTSDGGRTWSHMPSPKYEGALAGRQGVGNAHFFDRSLGWVNADGTLFLTSDGGKNWRHMRIGPSETLIHDLFFVPGGTVGWAAGGVYRKANPGEEGPNYVVTRDERTGLLLILEPAVFLTKDGGQSWSRASVLRSGDWEVRSVTFVTPQTGFAVGDRVLYRSSDGGRTWTPATIPSGCVLPGSRLAHRQSKANSFLDEKLGWVSFQDGSVFGTRDGGRTLCQQGPYLDDALLYLHIMSPTEGWGVKGYASLYKSSDGGRSWEWIDFPSPVASLSVLNNRHVWILSPDALYDVTLNPPRQ